MNCKPFVIWKTTDHFQGKYLFSSNGDVINIKSKTHKIIHKNLDKKQNNSLHISDKYGKKSQYTIHKIISELFLEKTGYNDIRHKDGNMHNNSADNLEYYDKKMEIVNNYLRQIPIIDPEERWDYSLIPDKNITSQTYVYLKCNGCMKKTKRTLYDHITFFKPCKLNCYTHQDKEYVLGDIETIEPANEGIIDHPEEWKIFPDNNNYEVSSKGFVRNIKTKKSFKGCLDKHTGYMRTVLNKIGVSLHIAVAKTFIPNPEILPCVNHKNKIRTDNRAKNLEWCSYRENNIHKTENKIKAYENHGNGRMILRLHKASNEILESYPTIKCACKWIMEKIHKIDTNGKDIDKQLKNNSGTLSEQIKRDGEWFGHGFIWKFEDEIREKEGEKWKLLESIEKKGYYISNFGRLKLPSNRIKDTFSKTGNYKSDGYYDIKFIKGGKHHKIHRLVAEAFIPKIEKKPFVNHKNGNTLDNSVENLEWVTNAENVQHAYDNHLNSKVSAVVQFDKTGKIKIAEFTSINEASRKLKINQSLISSVCREKQVQTHNFHFKYKKNESRPIRERKPSGRRSHSCN